MSIKSNNKWLTTKEVNRLTEIINQLSPSIPTSIQPLWEELKQIITTQKEVTKPRTYFITNIVKEKGQMKYKSGEEKKGKLYWKFKLDNDDDIYMYHDVIDNLAEYDKIAASIISGGQYEFEVEKAWRGAWRLRNVKPSK